MHAGEQITHSLLSTYYETKTKAIKKCNNKINQFPDKFGCWWATIDYILHLILLQSAFSMMINTFFFNDSNLPRYKKKRDNKLLWANAEKEVKTLKNAEISKAYFSKRI